MSFFRFCSTLCLVFYPVLMHSMGFDNIQYVYYQVAGNVHARIAQSGASCVIAQFSRMVPYSTISFNFQGMSSVTTREIISYQGQLSPFFLLDDVYCANMTKIDPFTGQFSPVDEHSPQRYLCAWKYDAVALDWILFTNREKTLLFALLTDRMSFSQKKIIDKYIDEWETWTNTTLLRTPYNQTMCNQFTPPQKKSLPQE